LDEAIVELIKEQLGVVVGVRLERLQADTLSTFSLIEVEDDIRTITQNKAVGRLYSRQSV